MAVVTKGGEGTGVRILSYEFPKDVHAAWSIHPVSDELHLTHNLFIKEENGKKTEIYVAGKEGVKIITEPFDTKQALKSTSADGKEHGSGEIKLSKDYFVTIQPMHGKKLVVYPGSTVLDTSFNEGHALGVGDFAGAGYDQIVAGWRNPDKDQQVGIKLYSKKGSTWESTWVDKNGMACEDLQVMDLNADGKPDIIASGRATKNLKVYWSK